MARIKLKYVNAFANCARKDRRMRYYFRRRGWKAIPLPGVPGSEEFMAVYAAALATVPEYPEIGMSRTLPGTVNALAVDSKQRSPLLPNVPTLAELGYGDNLTRLYFGIVAPAGTPQPIIHKLRDEFAAVGNDPQFRQKRMIDAGLEPVFDTPEEFARFLKDDRAISARIVRESGIEPQ